MNVETGNSGMLKMQLKKLQSENKDLTTRLAAAEAKLMEVRKSALDEGFNNGVEVTLASIDEWLNEQRVKNEGTGI